MSHETELFVAKVTRRRKPAGEMDICIIVPEHATRNEDAASAASCSILSQLLEYRTADELGEKEKDRGTEVYHSKQHHRKQKGRGERGRAGKRYGPELG